MNSADKNWLRLLAERILDTKTRILTLSGKDTSEEALESAWQTTVNNDRKELLSEVLKKAAEE
jgi:hypothetical protein